MHDNPTLNLDRSEIPVIEQYKFLSVIFDKKLSFIPYIQYLKEKCSETLKLLHVIAHKDWGLDQHTLLKLYRILIRSKIDYGCLIKGAARKSYFKSLQTVHHERLRLVLGAFRTSPVESLCSKAYKSPLKLRFTKEAFIFSAKICAINLALKLVSTSNKEKFIQTPFLFYNLLKTQLDNPFIVKLLNKLNSMNHSKKVIFCWIPSHIRIQGKN